MFDMHGQLWRVKPSQDSNISVITWATGRSQALRHAGEAWLDGYGKPDDWIADPITNPGDRVKLAITLNV